MLRVLVTALVLAASLAAQGVVRCEVRSPRVFEGQEIEYLVLVSGETEAKMVPPGPVEGLTFTLVDEGIINQARRVTIINGRRSEQVSADYLFRWRVEPARPGQYEIPAPVVTLGDRERKGVVTRLTVEASDSQDLAFIETSLSAAEVVRGGRVRITADVFLKKIPRGDGDPLGQHSRGRSLFRRGTPPPSLNIPWIGERLEAPLGRTGLEGEPTQSWLQRLVTNGAGFVIPGLRSRFDGEVKDLTRRGQPYRRYRFTTELTARLVGTYDLGPVVLDGNLVQERTDQRGQSRLEWREIFVRSDPLVVTVLEPPTEGRPASFTGAVAERLELTLEPPSPTKVRVGDPVYLTLVVAGDGFLSGVGLDLASQLGESFRVEEIGVTDSLPAGESPPPGFPERRGKWRQFDFKVHPLSADVDRIPEIEFAWYQPSGRRYLTASTEAVPLEVGGAASSDAKVVIAPKLGEGRRDVELVPTAAISRNVDDLNLLGDHRPPLGLGVILLAGMAATWAGLAAFVTRRRKLAADPALVRRRGARARASDRIGQARSASDPGAKIAALEAALLGFVADVTDRSEEALTGADLANYARSLSPDDDATLVVLARLGEAAEAVRFGGAADAGEIASYFEAGEALIARGSAVVKRGAKVGASLWLACALLAGPDGVVHAQDVERFRAAQEHFAAGRYREAARDFEAMLEADYANGYVLYNLGNAWFRAGELGRAIAAYRRAERFLPGDANLAVNLQRALDARTRPLSPETGSSVVDYLLFWRGHLPLRTQVWLAVALGGLAFVLGLVGLFRERWPGWLRGALVLTLALLLLFAISIALDRADQVDGRHGVIVEDGTFLRQGPGASFEPSFEQSIDQGSELVVVQRRGQWLQVRVADRYEGWIPAGTAVTW